MRYFIYFCTFVFALITSTPLFAGSYTYFASLNQQYNCATALLTETASYNHTKFQASDSGCTITSDTPPICAEGEGQCPTISWALEGVTNGSSSCAALFGASDGIWDVEGATDCDVAPSYSCGANSVLLPVDPDGAYFCQCTGNTLAASIYSTQCDVVPDDPCPPIVAACTQTCSPAAPLQNSCQSTDGALVGTPVCVCPDPPPDPDPPTPSACNPETGSGCATAARQDQQLGALGEISSNTAGLTESVDGIKAGIQSLDSKTNTTNSLLSQILSSPGIQSAGGGGGDPPPDPPVGTLTLPANEIDPSLKVSAKSSLLSAWASMQSAPIIAAGTAVLASFPSGASPCPAFSINIFGRQIATTLHCEVFSVIRSAISALMYAVWSILAIYVFRRI